MLCAPLTHDVLAAEATKAELTRRFEEDGDALEFMRAAMAEVGLQLEHTYTDRLRMRVSTEFMHTSRVNRVVAQQLEAVSVNHWGCHWSCRSSHRTEHMTTCPTQRGLAPGVFPARCRCIAVRLAGSTIGCGFQICSKHAHDRSARKARHSCGRAVTLLVFARPQTPGAATWHSRSTRGARCCRWPPIAPWRFTRLSSTRQFPTAGTGPPAALPMPYRVAGPLCRARKLCSASRVQRI